MGGEIKSTPLRPIPPPIDHEEAVDDVWMAARDVERVNEIRARVCRPRTIP